MNTDQLTALKIAFTYMPQAIDVTKFEYGNEYQKTLDHINYVREVLIEAGQDPDKLQGEINPNATPNSCY